MRLSRAGTRPDLSVASPDFYTSLYEARIIMCASYNGLPNEQRSPG